MTNILSDAPTFEGTKQLRACPMTKAEYCAYRNWDVPFGEDRTEAGYLVEYLDGGKPNDPRHQGYISWSPADVFDKTYRPVGSHVERMKVEHDELVQRIAKLHAFIQANPAFTALDAMGQELMRIQLSAMDTYRNVLGVRLAIAETGTAPELEATEDGIFIHDRPAVHVEL